MSEIRNPGKKCGIRVNKDAFKEFIYERRKTLRKVSLDLGTSENYLSTALNRGLLSVSFIDELAEYFSMRPQDMEFIDDEAHTLLYKLGIPFDGPMQKGNKIARIREYLAQGLNRDKIFELMYTPPIKKENDPKIKFIPMTVPKATLTHSAVSEAFDEVANSKKETLGNIISEHADKLVINTDAQIPTDPTDMYDSPFAKVVDETKTYHTSVRDAEKRLRLRELLLNSDPQIKNQFIMNVGRISNMERYLRDRERTTAQALAQEIVKYLVSCSEGRPRHIEDIDLMDNIINLYGKWSAMHESCKYLHIYVKKRSLLDTVYFFIVHGEFLMGFDAKYVDDIKLRLYEDVEFIGRYPINTDDVKACKKEEETENERT